MSLRSTRLSLLLIFTILATVRAQDVRITEFQVLNVSGIVDDNNTPQGWIEIWNPSTTTAVPLTNWRLSNVTTTWTFPAVVLNPDEFMVIWASGKNRTTVTAPLHTNFTLPTSGGTVRLLRSDSTVASTFINYPTQTADTSWGRDEGDNASTASPTQVGRYSSPTPGERNNFSGSGVAGKVVFDKTSRAFTGTLAVTLSQAVPDAAAVIRYTTNGSAPIANSTIYTVPLNVTTTQMIRARVYKTGLLPGETETNCYLLLDTTTSGFSSPMPILAVTNFGQGTPSDTLDQNTYFWLWEPAAPDNRARFINQGVAVAPTLFARGVTDRRGSSTLNNPKHNVNLEARMNRSDDDRDVSILGMADGSDYVLSGPYAFDPSDLHNPFIFALSRQIGRYAPDTRLVEVFFDTTGGALNAPNSNSNDYFGIYNLMEKIRRDKNRVDVQNLDTYDNDTVGKTGGYLWKVDRLDSGDGGFSAGGQTMAYYDPKEIEIELPQRDPQEQYLATYINTFNTALNSGTYTNPVTGYAAYIDVPGAVDHHLLNVWAFNVDALRLSGYWFKERGAKMTPGPIWDFDRALSSTDGRDSNPATWRSQSGDQGTDFFNYPWWARMFTDADFYQKYIDRWQELRRGAFSTSNVNALIDSLNAKIAPESTTRDLARWGQPKRSWTRPFTPFNTIAASQAAEVQRIKDWLQQRANFFDSQWVGPVTASLAAGNVAAGTQITLAGPVASTIRYTLDGSEPRPAGGGAAGASVLTYTGPITINATTRVKARAYKASWLTNPAVLIGANNPPLRSAWGGLTNVRYSTDTPAVSGNLVVTEINYHPTDPTTAELAVNPVLSDADFEFVELRNIGATPIDLGGAQFTQGITFAFTGNNAMTLAPGAYVVVAANPSAFAARYGAGATVVGPFTGDLDNSGEQLKINAANNATILDFTYDDAWYPASDGDGRTLVIYDPYAAPAAFSNAANWRESAANNGSPGATEPNRPPTVGAGTVVSGLVSGVNVAVTAADDSQPNPPRALTFSWSQTSGPGTAMFTPPDATVTTATFSLPGAYTLRLTANDSLLSAFGDVSVFAKDTPAAWLARHPGIGTLEDDFDRDGWNNFGEFSFNLDPSTPDVANGPVAVLEEGHLTITYTRIKPPSAVIYAIEVADDITAFRSPNPGEITEEIQTDDNLTQRVKVVDTVSTSSPPTRFMKLKVIPAP